jgi:hypothetical protein
MEVSDVLRKNERGVVADVIGGSRDGDVKFTRDESPRIRTRKKRE